MPTNPSESQLLEALRQLKHPEIEQRTLEELGMIQEVSVTDNRVAVTLALPLMQAPAKPALIDLVKHAISDMAPALEAEVHFTKMNPDQRAAFMAAARGEAPAPAAARRVGRVVAVMSGKGGVGKSSVAGLLAASLRRRGLRVGVLDADITGPSIPKVFGVQQPPVSAPGGIAPVLSRTGVRIMSMNLLLAQEDQPVIWRGPLISRAIEQFWKDIAWGDLDYLVVDLPPGTSDAALTVTQSLPLDGVLLVTSPQDLAGMVVRKAANLVLHMETPLIGMVENMSHVVCPHCGAAIDVFGVSRAENTARLVGTALLGRLPLDPDLAVLCDAGAIEDYVNDAFEAVVEGILQRLPMVAER